jgi:hypothetical protein
MIVLLITCSLFSWSCEGFEAARTTLEGTAERLLSAVDKESAVDAPIPSSTSVSQHIEFPALTIRPGSVGRSKLLEQLDKVVQSNGRLAKERRVAIVDYSRPIADPRFYIYDLKLKEVVYLTYVGHSSYSGYNIPSDFSNTPKTRKTSLGLYQVGREYHGKFGRSKRLRGLSESNSNAYRRAIVIHAMPDGHPDNLYSWGCLTFFQRDLSDAFELLGQGTYVMVVS